MHSAFRDRVQLIILRLLDVDSSDSFHRWASYRVAFASGRESIESIVNYKVGNRERGRTRDIKFGTLLRIHFTRTHTHTYTYVHIQ